MDWRLHCANACGATQKLLPGSGAGAFLRLRLSHSAVGLAAGQGEGCAGDCREEGGNHDGTGRGTGLRERLHRIGGRRDLNLRLEDRDLRLAGLGRLIPGLPGSAGCVGSPGFVGALYTLVNVAASTVSPSFAYETAAVSVLSAVAVTVMVAAVTVMVAAYSVLSYVTPSALPATCTSVYSYVPAASNGSWSKVTVPSAAFVVVPGIHHVRSRKENVSDLRDTVGATAYGHVGDNNDAGMLTCPRASTRTRPSCPRGARTPPAQT